MCFVDLCKAYDSVSRVVLWLVLRQQGVPGKLVDLLEDLHTGSNATVKAFGGESRPFEIKGGVRQGCNIAPLLFNIFLDFVTKQAASQFGSNRRNAGVSFKFSFEGKPFITPAEGVGDLELLAILMYADDMALVAEDDQQLNHQIQHLDLRPKASVSIQKDLLQIHLNRLHSSMRPLISQHYTPLHHFD